MKDQENATHSQEKRKSTENSSTIIKKLDEKDFLNGYYRAILKEIKQNILSVNEQIENLNRE